LYSYTITDRFWSTFMQGAFHSVVATVPEAASRYGARFNIVEEADHISVCRPPNKTSRSFLALTSFFRSVEHSKMQYFDPLMRVFAAGFVIF
jgi:hypothetical protein